VRQKFTGYQKDIETSLDFAEARMYENRFGRFTAVDPLLASGKSANPQTFNRYVYTGNRPLIYTDPSGLDWYEQTINGRTSYRWSSDNKTFDDGSAVDDWSLVNFSIGSTFQYQGCINAECSENKGAALYKGGGWDWTDSFSYQARDYFRTMARDFRNFDPIKATKHDWNYFWSDPLGERGLGNPGLAFVTGGLATGLQNVSRTATLFDTAVDTGSTLTKTVQFEQYSLRAAKDGMYPVMQRGFKEPVGSVFLNKGDIWKFGQTTRGPARYSATWLEDTGLVFRPEFKTPSFKEVLQVERQRIIQYEQTFGNLPPGNKIRR
jgi:RHS repeat-associated protein